MPYVLEDAPSGRYVLEDGPPAAVSAGGALNDIPRQIGLTARYGLEGLANTAQIVTEPIRAVTDRLFGQTGKTLPLGALATKAADAIGLPSPQGANERVIGDATRLVAGAGGLGGAARVVAGAPGAVGAAGEFLSANMPQQLASAAGAGLAGGASREAGGSPLMQGGAALIGGVGAGVGTQMAGNLGRRAVSGARSLIPGQQQAIQQRLDQRINIVLEQQGIDPATITPAMRSALREQVGRALNTGGELNPEAVARLADYTRLNLTPTRARLTLDPFDVTQEENASKLAAATGSRDARLPQIANENNRRLISIIDEMGGARPADTYGQGNAAIAPIVGRNSAMEQAASGLYRQARDSAGRPALMDHVAFTQRANRALDEAMLGHALPTDVHNRLNRIAQGQEGPFSVEYVETLKKQLNSLSGSTNDRAAQRAISTVRNALEDTPLMGAPSVNPGNLPAVAGTVPPSPQIAGREALEAFAQARAAHRERMQWQESSPVIQRAIDGAIPDTFIQQNILSKAAGFDGVARAAETINQNPAARDAVRVSIVQHLKDASIGKGGTSQTGNFSGRNVEAALKDIGDRKLGLFFEPAEIETMKAMARTGAFEVFQPRGSAVNNSNSAAGIGAIVSSIVDRVRPVTNKIPGVNIVAEYGLLGPAESFAASAMQRPVMNIPQGLLMPQNRPPMGQGLLLPGMAAGGTAAGLLAAP